MAKDREIQTRIKAVGNIERITKTMKMIATARFQASQRRAVSAQPYTRKIRELVGELATSTAGGEFSHPLMGAPDPSPGRELVLVLTSNRGLCGAYNANVLRAARQHLNQLGDTPYDLEVVGKKGAAAFRFQRLDIARMHSQFGDAPQYEDVERLATEYMDAFAAGKYDAVRVVYMAFETTSRQRPVVQQLLPLAAPSTDDGAGASGAGGGQVDYESSPDPQTLLGELLPASVRAQLFQCFNEAVVSEHVARMVAMSAATDNAAEMSKTLTRLYNRARQSRITTELTEIIGGAAALE